MVYVKLYPYSQVSAAHRSNAKFSPKYLAPIRIIDYIVNVHNVFHVSKPIKHVGDSITSTNLPYQTEGELALSN